MSQITDSDRKVVLASMADRISAQFMGGVPRRPVIAAIEETLREEGLVLVNEWDEYRPRSGSSGTDD